MHPPTLTEAVRRELIVRSEVTESTHRFGGIEFRLGRREPVGLLATFGRTCRAPITAWRRPRTLDVPEAHLRSCVLASRRRHPGRCGQTSREDPPGHLHGDHLADLPFPRRVRDELVAAGRAEPHHALPDSGWVTRRVDGPQDVEAVVALFRLAYERAVKARGARERATAAA